MVHLLHVSSHLTNINWVPRLEDRMSGHYSCLVCRAHIQSSVSQLLLRCVFIERSHVDVKRGETACKSLVDMEQEKTH